MSNVYFGGEFLKNTFWKHLYIVILVIFFLSLLTSCDLLQVKPGGKNFTEIDEPQNPIIEFSLSSPNDTLTVWGDDFRLNYSASSSTELKLLKIYIDEELRQIIGIHTYMRIALIELEEGLHTLRIDVHAATNSGSIADLLEEEYYIESYSYPLHYLAEAPPYTPEISSVHEQNGSLKIEWAEYPYDNFTSYKVYHVNRYENIIETITERDINYCIDNYFLGGMLDFRVDVEIDNETISGNIFSFDDGYSPTITKVEVDQSLNAKIYWNHSPYYNNYSTSPYRHYTIFLGNYPFEVTAEEAIANIYDFNTKYIEEPMAFGKKIFLGGYLNNRNTTYPDITSEEIELDFYDSVNLPNNWDKMTPIQYVSSLNSYYGYNDLSDVTYRVNAENNSIVAENSSQISVSKCGTRAYSINEFVIKQHDPDNLNVIDSFDISSLLGETQTSLLVYALPNDRVLVKIREYSYPQWINSILYIDLESMTLLDHVGYRYVADISEDSEYLLCFKSHRRYLYKLGSSSLVLEETHENTVGQASFINNNRYLIGDSSYSCSIYNISNGAYITSFDLIHNMDISNYDPVSECYIGHSQNADEVYVYDLNTYNCDITIPVARGLYKFYGLNNKLISSKGLLIDMEDYRR